MEYRDLKTDPMQEAVRALLEKSKKAPVTDKDDDGEGMDPVGHGDKDIDNDGDHDSTDKYLTKRRKAITKNVKGKDEVEEETVKLVDMDDDSHQNALKLAKKAGVKVVSKKTNTGTELSVSGSNKNIGKFMMSLPEEVQQIDEIINSLGHRDGESDAKRDQIRRERESEKKRKGGLENQYQALKKNLEGLRVSHDAYVDRYHAADEKGDDEAAERAREASDRIYDKMQDIEDKMAKLRKSQKNESVNTPTKANGGIAHDCATHVAHEEYGLGTCVSEEHTLAEDGTVSHYDVIFERVGLKRDVPVNELKITASEKHLHASKKKHIEK